MSETLPLNGIRVLVTGASGLLGFALLPVLLEAGASVIGVWRHNMVRTPGVETLQCDLQDREATLRLLGNVEPDWVIHAAALTGVDRCEADPALAEASNVDATASIASMVGRWGARLVYLSSESVYGDGSAPHSEGDPCQPLSVYARTKLAGEVAALQGAAETLVVRTTLVGTAPDDRRSLVAWLLRSFLSGQQVTGFKDVFFSPLFTNDLSRMLVAAMSSRLTGIWNLGAADACSKYEFARALATALGYDETLVQPGLLREATLSGPRCYQAALDSRRFAQRTDCALPTVLAGVSGFAANAVRPLAFEDRPTGAI